MPPTTTGDPRYIVTEAMIISRNWHRRQAPFFRVETVARVFFAMSASWLRLKMTADAEHPNTWFTNADGSPIEFRRAAPAVAVRLDQVEQMACSLVKFGAIDDRKLNEARIAILAEEKRTAGRAQKPAYTPRKLGKLFFGMPAAWVDQKLAADDEHPRTWFVDATGAAMEFTRESVPARVFTIADVEPMAHSLHRFGAIDSRRRMQILDVVQAMAALYGLFDEPPGGPGDDEGAENSALGES